MDFENNKNEKNKSNNEKEVVEKKHEENNQGPEQISEEIVGMGDKVVKNAENFAGNSEEEQETLVDFKDNVKNLVIQTEKEIGEVVNNNKDAQLDKKSEEADTLKKEEKKDELNIKSENVREKFSVDIFTFLQDNGINDFDNAQDVKQFISRGEQDNNLYNKYKTFSDFSNLVAQLSLTSDTVADPSVSEKIGVDEDSNKKLFAALKYEEDVLGEDYISPGEGGIKDFEVVIEKLRTVFLAFRGVTRKSKSESVEFFQDMFVLNLAQQFQYDGKMIPPELKMLVRNEYLHNEEDLGSGVDLDFDKIWDNVKDAGIKKNTGMGAHPKIAERKFDSEMSNNITRALDEDPDADEKFIGRLFNNYPDIRKIIEDILV